MRKEFLEETPAPDTYQTKNTEPATFTPAYKPFQYASERFPVTKKDVEEATPGWVILVNNYNLHLLLNSTGHPDSLSPEFSFL